MLLIFVLLLIFTCFSGHAQFSAYTVIYIDEPIIIIELKLSGTYQIACLMRKRGLHSPREPHRLSYICFGVCEVSCQYLLRNNDASSPLLQPSKILITSLTHLFSVTFKLGAHCKNDSLLTALRQNCRISMCV